MTALVAAAVLLGALAQSVSGIGFVLVCGPLLVGALGPDDGVRLALVLSVPVNLVVLSRTWRATSLRDLVLLGLPSVVVVPLVGRLLREAPDRVAAAAAGAVAVLGAAALASGLRWRAAAGRAGAVGAGLLSGATNVAAGIGGPPVALYAENADKPPAWLRSTGQLFFLSGNLLALAALGLPQVGATVLVACLGALAVGLAVGGPLAQRVPERAARRTTLALAATGGLVVLVRAVLG